MISFNSTNKTSNSSYSSFNSVPKNNNQSGPVIEHGVSKMNENYLNGIDQPYSITNIANKTTNNYEIVEYENQETNGQNKKLNQSSQVSQINYHNNIPACNIKLYFLLD